MKEDHIFCETKVHEINCNLYMDVTCLEKSKNIRNVYNYQIATR